MILRAVTLASLFSRLIIRSDDTDVLVLLLYYFSEKRLSDEVFMHAGHSTKFVTRTRFIHVHLIAAKLGTNFCKCLPAAHALTGCDTTSSLFGIGKKTVYTALQKIADLKQLANFNQPNPDHGQNEDRKFVLSL